MKKIIILVSFTCSGHATPPPKPSIKIAVLNELAQHRQLAPGTPVMCKNSPAPYTVHDDCTTDSTRYVTMSRPHVTWCGLPTTKMPVTLKQQAGKDIEILRGSITTTPFGKFVNATAICAKAIVTCAGMYALYQLKAFIE